MAVKLPLAAMYSGVLPPWNKVPPLVTTRLLQTTVELLCQSECKCVTCSRWSIFAPAANRILHISVNPCSAAMCIDDCNLYKQQAVCIKCIKIQPLLQKYWPNLANIIAEPCLTDFCVKNLCCYISVCMSVSRTISFIIVQNLILSFTTDVNFFWVNHYKIYFIFFFISNSGVLFFYCVVSPFLSFFL